MSTIKDVRDIIYKSHPDLGFDFYSPGDGITRYRFFEPGYGWDYFSAPHPYGTALGARDAIIWLDGWAAAKGRVNP